VTALVVVVAGAAGLAGLLVGRAIADRLGRRAAVAGAMVLVPAAGILTYSGSVPAVVAGYLVAVLTGSAFLPAMGSLQAELFPTAVRSAVAGWLVTAGVLGSFVGLLVFGVVADADDRFGLAAVLVFAPAMAAAGLVALVPETRGWDLDADARG
jgi:predicted MFS family arabinose efflux permease